MPDTTYWSDPAARSALKEQGRAILARILDQVGPGAVVAIDPASGEHFVGRTLGQANDLAYARYPDRWLYFARTDDPDAEIVLPTW
jgi:hypothetical protein